MKKLPDKQKVNEQTKQAKLKELTERTAWHPAFRGAIELEFREHLNALEIITEYPLTSEALKIDIVIIKKILDILIDKSFARIFGKHNILEYKSPNVSVSIRDYFKTQCYSWLYAAREKGVDIRDMSMTMILTKRHRNFFNDLQEIFDTKSHGKGIYFVNDCKIRSQIVVIDELPEAENIWLTGLRKNLTQAQLKQVKDAGSKLQDKSSAMDAYFNTVFGANYKTYKLLDEDMKTLTQHLREEGIADILFAEEFKKLREEVQEKFSKERKEERLEIEARFYADKIDTVRKLKYCGMDDRTIVAVTGLPLKKIKQLKPVARMNVSRKR